MLTDDELEFLTKTLRGQNRRAYLVWWVFAAAAFGVFFWVWSNLLQQESPDLMFLATQAFAIGIGLMASIFGLLELARMSDKRKLIAILLRFVNNDPETLQQLSAKRGLGDLTP